MWLLWDEFCPCQNSYVEDLNLIIQNVTVFGDSAFIEVTKFK
jgi:hypothetical protein